MLINNIEAGLREWFCYVEIYKERKNFMKKIGLVPRLIISIVLGILLGLVLPSPIIRIFVTFSSLFSKYLSFIIPFMIIGFVVTGISDLRHGAGKLLGITQLYWLIFLQLLQVRFRILWQLVFFQKFLILLHLQRWNILKRIF